MLNFRRFTDQDLPELMSWFPDREDCGKWGGPEFRVPFTEDSFREDAKLESLASWSLVRPDQSLCAFGQYYDRLGRCHFGRLAVAPSARGQGLGTTLMRELADRGRKELGADSCSLFVLADNEPALRLYKRLGFVARPYPEPGPAYDPYLYMVASELEST